MICSPSLGRTLAHAWFCGLGLALLGASAGCNQFSRFGGDPSGAAFGKVFYVGGAGPVGNMVGARSVAEGLRRGGYVGAIEPVAWQSVLGGTLRDQMDIARNREQARRLADKICDYHDAYPGRRVHLIGLSAGTGIIAWAAEELPPGYRIDHVVFLGSSMAREYDLTPLLSKIDGQLWNFYSTSDPILRYAVPITGSVDRSARSVSLAGLFGFAPPRLAEHDARSLYRDKLRNMGWRTYYRQFGYHGRHTDSVKPAFVAEIIEPLLDQPSVRQE